jgi:CheY-like chemotaxis protein/anti-sigma regulatory factor (Ser/Thr protein kinase)
LSIFFLGGTVSPSGGAAARTASATPGRTALVVDSGSDINDLIDDVLTSEGWSIQRVPDNQAILTIAATEPFDLIITGAKTHGPEDLELLREIRCVRPHQRLIILTEQWTPGDVIAAIREGAFSYLSAPFERYPLLEMVRNAMASSCWDDGIEILSATPDWVTLMARCDSVTADRLVQFLGGVREPVLPENDREAVVQAFREILLNAMEHGCKFDSNQYVEISFLRTRRAVVCRIKDPGQGFSLEELRHTAISSPAGDLISHTLVREEQGLRPGGFGLMMAKKLVDELIYNEQGNDVLLIKYLHPRASQVA